MRRKWAVRITTCGGPPGSVCVQHHTLPDRAFWTKRGAYRACRIVGWARDVTTEGQAPYTITAVPVDR